MKKLFLSLVRLGRWTWRHLRGQRRKQQPKYPPVANPIPEDSAVGHAWTIALLVDGDNAQPTLIPPVLAALARYGRCVIRRVYGDWSTNNSPAWRNAETVYALQRIQQSRHANGKNATDIAMTIAAMDLWHSRQANAFCLMSSDSDFTPLVVRLKDEGALVIGVGRPNTPRGLVNACSVFFSTADWQTLTASTAKTPVPGQPRPADMPDARSLLRQACERVSHDGQWIDLSVLGGRVRQLDPTFSAHTYGKKTLVDLVKEYPDLFDVQVRGNGTNPQVRLKC